MVFKDSYEVVDVIASISIWVGAIAARTVFLGIVDIVGFPRVRSCFVLTYRITCRVLLVCQPVRRLECHGKLPVWGLGPQWARVILSSKATA